MEFAGWKPQAANVSSSRAFRLGCLAHAMTRSFHNLTSCALDCLLPDQDGFKAESAGLSCTTRHRGVQDGNFDAHLHRTAPRKAIKAWAFHYKALMSHSCYSHHSLDHNNLLSVNRLNSPLPNPSGRPVERAILRCNLAAHANKHGLALAIRTSSRTCMRLESSPMHINLPRLGALDGLAATLWERNCA